MIERDYYQILGLPRDATSADVRSAFVRLARHHHPDQAGHADELPWRLHDVQQAYRCLSDADARAAHDRALRHTESSHFARQRKVRRKLRRYDSRHPHRVLGLHRSFHWRTMLMVVTSVAFIASVSLRMIS